MKTEIQKFLMDYVKKLLAATVGKNPDLSKVIIWVESYDSKTGIVVLGLALGTGTGCSPFCGCAARQITEYIEGLLKNKFSFVKKVRGEPGVPSQVVLDEWN